MKKIIMVMDIDAFFAQAEEKRNPSYIGKPIGVGTDMGKRTILTTLNYPARKKGMYSGIPLFKAKKIIPNIILVESDYQYYQDLSEKVFQIVNSYTKKMEVRSIDECYFDVTNILLKKKITALELAKEIQLDILEKTALTVSIGISTNKLLAKTASGLKKPFGIETLFEYEIKSKLWPLEIRELFGSGLRSSDLFISYNIKTIGDLATLKANDERYSNLSKIMGKRFMQLHNSSNGKSSDIIDTDVSTSKSISHSKTYENRIIGEKNIMDELYRITQIVFRKVRYRNLLPKTFTLTFKAGNDKKTDMASLWNVRTRSYTTPSYAKDIDEAWSAIKHIYDKENNQYLRFLSVSMSNFVDGYHYKVQKKLFDVESNHEEETTQELIKQLNNLAGGYVFGSGLDFKNVKRFSNKKLNQSDSVVFKITEWKKKD